MAPLDWKSVHSAYDMISTFVPLTPTQGTSADVGMHRDVIAQTHEVKSRL